MLDVLKYFETFVMFTHRITGKLENIMGLRIYIALKINTKCTLAIIHQLHSSEGQV